MASPQAPCAVTVGSKALDEDDLLNYRCRCNLPPPTTTAAALWNRCLKRDRSTANPINSEGAPSDAVLNKGPDVQCLQDTSILFPTTLLALEFKCESQDKNLASLFLIFYIISKEYYL